MKNIAEELARLVTTTGAGALPTLALERAKMSLASTVASAAMGVAIPSACAIRELALARGGTPQASVWFSQEKKLDVAGAAQVNAVASDAAACDDSDLRSIAHIGTIVSTVAIAVAEHLGRGGREVLEAMVLGYEVAGRIDEALTPGRMKRGFHGSVSTIFGGAVAAGRLLGLDQARLAHAIALTASSACGMAIAADTSCAREYHAGLAAQLGVQAAFAAQRGFTSETAVLEAPRGFFQAMNGQAVDEVIRGWGASWDITTDMAIKLMPGAHPFHAIAEAAAEAARAGNVDPRQVDAIVISAIQMRDWGDSKHPRDLGVPFRRPVPDPIVQDPVTLEVAASQPYIHRLTLLGAEATLRGSALPFIDEASRLLWDGSVTGWDQGEHLARAAERAGLGEMQRAIAADPAPRKALIEANQAAQHAAGHWGVPLFVFEGEPLLRPGQDRRASLAHEAKRPAVFVVHSADQPAVIAYAAARIGHRYDLKNVIDLAPLSA